MVGADARRRSGGQAQAGCGRDQQEEAEGEGRACADEANEQGCAGLRWQGCGAQREGREPRLGLLRTAGVIVVCALMVWVIVVESGPNDLGALGALPLGDACVDTILFHQVLHYAQEPQAVLAEAARVARAGAARRGAEIGRAHV